MIKTKSVYYDNIKNTDGIRILVMRKWCRPLSKKKAKIDEWLKELGPSKELLQDWKDKKIDFTEYSYRYLNEMKKQIDIIRGLSQRSKSEIITLLCCEKTDEQCHRRLLKNLIDKYV